MMSNSTIRWQFSLAVAIVSFVLLVAESATAASAFSFDNDPANGSILLGTRSNGSGMGGEVVWLKHSSMSGIQGTGNHFNVSEDDGVTDFPAALAVGRFDGDTNGDLIVGRSGGNLGFGVGVTTWVERSAGSLTGVHNFTTTPVNSIAIGELGDGNFADVIVGRDDGQITWLRKATGSDAITANHTFNQGTVSAVAIGNFDGDPNGDILVAKPSGLTLNWSERSAINTISGVHNFNVSPANSIAMGDPDGGSVDDVFVGRDDGFVTWAFDSGSNSITACPLCTYNAGGVTDLAFANVQTGDPFQDVFGDLFVARPDGTILWIETDALNQNMSAIDFITAAGVGSTLTTIDAGNFDGDSDIDIIVGRSDGGGTSGSVGWYEVTDTGGQYEIVERQQFFNVGAPVTDLQIAPPGVGGVTGDFNGDNQWNCTDIDALTNAIATSSGDLSFDMNGDGVITLADVTDASDGWLAVGGANNPGQTGGNPFLNGDANIDGFVDGSDFGIWNGSKFTSNTAWCSGNFNGDAVVDGSDFGIWNGNKFMSSNGTSAVPEPGSAAGGLLLCLAALRAARARDND